MSTTRKYFGTDGVRGRANEGAITSEFAVKLGRALGARFPRNGKRHRVVIGKDTRLSGYMLETALASGIVSSGVDVVLVGPLPTPGIAFITQGLRCDAGIVISASHNPYTDNGIKLFDGQGYKLPDSFELEIESLIDSEMPEAFAPSEEIGYATRVDDAVGRYVVSLKSSFPQSLSLDGLKIVVDCAHGACYKVSPAVFEELGARVIPVAARPNGTNINAGVGALHPEHCASLVKEYGADVGIALDGDGDRIVMVDNTGAVVNGDALLGLCALELHDNGKLRHQKMVATIMSNLGLDRFVASRGIEVLRSNVGDRYVMEKLRELDLSFGGENSGHIIYRDLCTTGDGTLAGLQVLAQMVRTGISLRQLVAAYEPVPQQLVAVAVAERVPLESIPGYTNLLSQAQSELGDSGRVLVRYSGTEPKIRIMLESESEVLNEKFCTAFMELFSAV